MTQKFDDIQPGSAEKSKSRNNVLIFKIIAISFPFLLLIIIEFSLKLFHYGPNLDLFIPYKDDANYLVFNPDASRKYFIDPAFATKGNVELFKKKKDSNTYRIFVLGESTTIGYPYLYNGSFHRWLQYRLMHTFPEKNFEIINLSLTAVNSYTILGFAKELVDYKPDAVLIYVGQNEYYGALGVGSTQTLSGNPALVNIIIGLRQLKTIQLVTNIYRNTVNLLKPKETDASADRMKLMVGNQEIPYQSKLYKSGINQFKSNIGKTLQILEKKGIPVFLSNLVSNEKDLPPFISTTDDKSLPASFKIKYDQGLKALEARDSAVAFSEFKKAYQAYQGYALCNFYLGQLTYKQGDFKAAKKYFSKAKDLDLLRFRASEELNKTISELCSEYKNTHLVDTKAEFERHSPNQIIGDNLVIDHVHPNLQGYALMSDAFYEAMKLAHLLRFNPKTEMSYEQLLKEMPLSIVDSLAGVYRIHNLKGHWPFNNPEYQVELPATSFEEVLARKLAFEQMDWMTVHKNLFAYYEENNRLPEASKVTEAMVLENPTIPQFYEISAKLKMELKNYDESLFYSQQLFNLSPSFEKAKYLFVAFLKLDEPSKALPFLNYAISNNSEGSNLNPVKTSVQMIIQLQNLLKKDPKNVDALARIATIYMQMYNHDGAVKYYGLALKIDPQNKEAQQNLKQLFELNQQ